MSATNVEPSWYEPTTGRLDGERPVSDLMTTSAQAEALEVSLPRIPWVSAFATVREAAHLMASRRLGQVQVRNGRGEIVGILSTSDLYRWVTRTAPESERPEERGEDEDRPGVAGRA